jgi:hypothetical protein
VVAVEPSVADAYLARGGSGGRRRPVGRLDGGTRHADSGAGSAGGSSGCRAARVGGVQQRAVLAMLALHLNQVASTDLLVDGLWGEQAPASAVNTVQVYV